MKQDKFYVVANSQESEGWEHITIGLDSYEQAESYMNDRFCKNKYPNAFIVSTFKKINQMTTLELDDFITEKYEVYKSDFEMLWDEKESYQTFENWWNDFLKMKFNEELNKKRNEKNIKN